MNQYRVDFKSEDGLLSGSLIVTASDEEEAEEIAIEALDDNVALYPDYPEKVDFEGEKQVVFKEIELDHYIDWSIEEVQLIKAN